jgi:rhodanese-related sulfurtransferase
MKLKPIDPSLLKKRLDEGNALLIDVREANEYAHEHIPGARLVPLSRIAVEEFGEDRQKAAVFYCRSGARTSFNSKLLLSKGFREAYGLSGGIMAWKAAGLPTQSRRGYEDEIRRKRFWLF